MSNQICDGNGATIAFATSGFVGVFNQISGFRRFREAIKITSLADDSDMYCPGKVKQFDPIECEIQYDFQAQPPFDGAEETITITLPLGKGETTKGTIQGTGFISESTTATLANGELGLGSCTLQWSAMPTVTPGS